ncbi:MAG: hypothetical protein AAB316_12415, partial [Bacteroidota bacterium]
GVSRRRQMSQHPYPDSTFTHIKIGDFFFEVVEGEHFPEIFVPLVEIKQPKNAIKFLPLAQSETFCVAYIETAQPF